MCYTMIISHLHRYIFFAIPKTGTHSVRQALRPTMGDADLEQVGLFVQKKFPFPELRDTQHGHFSAMDIRPVVGEQVFSSYLKFAFVRNPFDRFVSYCAFMSRKTGSFEAAPIPFMKHVVRDLRPLHHILFRPQTSFVADADGRLLIDFVGRNETMQSSYDALCERLNLPTTTLARINSSSRRAYQEYFDADLIGWVSDLYRTDLEMFNYRFD
jgi:Sulfotransferase family